MEHKLLKWKLKTWHRVLSFELYNSNNSDIEEEEEQQQQEQEEERKKKKNLIKTWLKGHVLKALHSW